MYMGIFHQDVAAGHQILLLLLALLVRVVARGIRLGRSHQPGLQED